VKGHRRNAILWTIAISAMVAVTAAAFGVYHLVANWRSRSVEPFQTMKIESLIKSGKSINAAISPDGKYVAHVVQEADLQSLRVRQIAKSSNIRIMPPAQLHYQALTFSRDGNYIYYVASEKNQPPSTLYQIPALGGDSRKLIVGVDSPVTLSPDGRRLAFVRSAPPESVLIIANADGTEEKKLAVRRLPDPFWKPAWS